MAVKTRTPRTSSGARKERKTVTFSQQNGREHRNIEAIQEHKSQPYFAQVNTVNSKGQGKRPSKIRRAAERAQRRHEQAQQESEG